MKYTKIGFSAIFAIFCAYAVAVSPANALVIGGGDTGGQSTGNGGDTSASAAAPVAPTIGNGGDTSGPAIGNGGNTSSPATGNGGDTSGPAIGNGGSTAGPAIGNGGDTSTRGTGNGGDTSGPAIGNGGDTSGSGSTGGNGGSTGGGSTGGGSTSGSGSVSYGSGGGSRRTSSGSSSTVPTLTNIVNCGYITTYMKMGADNDTNEVTKLQNFLKNTEKFDVDVNGIFDEKTFDAVKAFQEKYVNDVMAPWGVTSPTGQVYFTTQKKINEIYCKSNFSLTAEQLAAIEAYKKGIQDGTITVNTNGEVVSTTTVSDNSSTTASTTNPLTASAANTSIFSKIWSFIKWLFGYNR